MTRIRVLANLCWMVPGDVGGSEEYTSRLLAAVAADAGADAGAGDDRVVDLTVAAMRGVARAHPELAELTWRELGLSGARRPVRVVAESTWLARESRHHDLVHHFGGRVPARRTAPAVVTIHDIQPLELPANFARHKRTYLARALPRTAAAARMIVTPSEWVAERVVDRLAVEERRVRVVPSTYDFVSAPGESGSDDRVRALGDGPVVLYPAMTHPHKDHATLLAAFSRLRERHPDVRLVLTGGPGRCDRAVQGLIAATPGVAHWGRVPPPTLRGLLARADVLAFPSRHEGFGLPALEAMRVGTPVVAADATALREVVGGGGVLVDPGDIDAWTDAIDDVLRHGISDHVRNASRLRVEHYAPGRARARLLAAWQAAAE